MEGLLSTGPTYLVYNGTPAKGGKAALKDFDKYWRLHGLVLWHFNVKNFEWSYRLNGKSF